MLGVRVLREAVEDHWPERLGGLVRSAVQPRSCRAWNGLAARTAHSGCNASSISALI